MKPLLTLLMVTYSVTCWSQSDTKPPLSVTIIVRNELTGKPIDADLEWPDPAKTKKAGRGNYTVVLDPGQSDVLTVTRDGYFDTNLKLDYTEEETLAYHEVKLKPGVPQLVISITSSESSETLKAAIDLFTMDEKSIVFSEEVETPAYTIDLEYNEVHVLQVRSPGYFSFKDTIDYRGVFDGRERTRKIELVPLKVGNKITVRNIYFKPNESELTDFAKLMLVELTHVLAEDAGLRIEVGAHSDDVGTNEYNLSLSEKRAMSVKKHLLEKGAKDDQLVAKGYGESSPVVANDSEENRAQNRRVEFKILKVD
jgi:outer membrane protein OmpA-like peptidoglycan-associated protein